MMRFNNGDNLGRVAWNIGGADAAIGGGDPGRISRLGGGDLNNDVVPSNEGIAVLTSMVTLSQTINFPGMMPQGLVGARPPSSVIADTSMIARSNLPPGLSLSIEAITHVLGKRRQVLVAHADTPGVDPGGDILAGPGTASGGRSCCSGPSGSRSRHRRKPR